MVAVSYTHLEGDMQPPGCRRLRVRFLIYMWCSRFLFGSSEWRAHVSKLEVRPFFRWGAALCNAGVRAMSFAYRASRTCTHVSTLEMRPFYLVWNLQYAVQMLCDEGC